jgi:hypothetical protein
MAERRPAPVPFRKKKVPVEVLRPNGDKLNREEALEGHDLKV